MHFWHLPGNEDKAKALFTEFAPTLDFFERIIGPYPFADEKVAAVETPHLGMEHQTINAYGNEYKPAQEGYDWLFSHEFAHEWFGNQLTNRDWDDMWLHEGIGSYMQPLYIRERQGEQAYHAMLWKQRAGLLNNFPIVSGKPRLEHEVYNPETGPGGDIYTKGSLIMHTLRGLIGDEPFFRSVRRLVYGRPDPAPGNFEPRFGTTDEFQAIASRRKPGATSSGSSTSTCAAPSCRGWSSSGRATVVQLQWRTPARPALPDAGRSAGRRAGADGADDRRPRQRHPARRRQRLDRRPVRQDCFARTTRSTASATGPRPRSGQDRQEELRSTGDGPDLLHQPDVARADGPLDAGGDRRAVRDARSSTTARR